MYEPPVRPGLGELSFYSSQSTCAGDLRDSLPMPMCLSRLSVVLVSMVLGGLLIGCRLPVSNAKPGGGCGVAGVAFWAMVIGVSANFTWRSLRM